MSELGDNKPAFGEVLKKPKVRVQKAPIKGQASLGLDQQLPPATLPEPTKEATLKRKIKERRRFEKEKKDWDNFVFNEGTRDEFRRQGRYYIIDQGVDPLGLFNIPPRTGSATQLGHLTSGEVVFMFKDSEKADERFRKGWAEAIVLEPSTAGEKPKIKTFNDGFVDRTTCRVWHQGVIDRQVVT